MAIQEPQSAPEQTKSDLLLPSLEIKNFRAFRHLSIEKLGRVNLVTGKNNVGKTSLLEALWLYSQEGSPAILRDLLTTRREFSEWFSSTSDTARRLFKDSDDQEEMFSIRFLYYGRPELSDIKNFEDYITIGPLNLPSRQLILAIRPSESEEENPGQAELSLNDRRQLYFDDLSRRLAVKQPDTPMLIVDMGGKPVRAYSLNYVFSRINPPRSEASSNNSQYVSSSGLADYQLGSLWDKVALTDLEDEVISALHIILPSVGKVNLRGGESLLARTPYVRLNSSNDPVPLRTLGEGVNRMFGAALALVTASNSLLLFDEIENGLHYSVLPDIWRLIFQTARRLNVQVFATTHSWDCIEAFQIAAAESPEEGVLVKLRQNSMGDVEAIVFDEDELAIITRDQIEVR